MEGGHQGTFAACRGSQVALSPTARAVTSRAVDQEGWEAAVLLPAGTEHNEHCSHGRPGKGGCPGPPNSCPSHPRETRRDATASAASGEPEQTAQRCCTWPVLGSPCTFLPCATQLGRRDSWQADLDLGSSPSNKDNSWEATKQQHRPSSR